VKIKNFPSSEEFCIKDSLVGNIECKLIFPNKIDIKWTDDNKIFRSSVWTKEGELISASWKKFTNLEEQPDFEPLDINGDLEYLHKLDGSTLIITKFQGNLIHRTRRTIDASFLENGDEIEFLKKKYPKAFDNELLNSEEYSILTEWYSPKNVIVEREAKEPTLWLTGIIKHSDYSYLSQKELDSIANDLELERPKIYQFNTLNEMKENVETWQKGEGIVVYGNNGQILKKIKSLKYLQLHRIKSHLSSVNNLVEYYVEHGMPSYEVFYKKIETEFDFEIAEQIKDSLQKISDATDKCKKNVGNMKDFCLSIRGFATRKLQAEHIITTYGSRASYVFNLLDGKKLSDSQWIKMISFELSLNP